jgi:hypothetical protein
MEIQAASLIEKTALGQDYDSACAEMSSSLVFPKAVFLSPKS